MAEFDWMVTADRAVQDGRVEAAHWVGFEEVINSPQK